MATNTYVALDKITVTGSSTASITFSNIPQTYTDLVLIARGSAGSGANCYIRFNGDTTNNYSATYMSGNGTSTESGRNTSSSGGYIGAFYGNSMCITHVMNYTNTTTYKTFLSRQGDAAQFTRAYVDLWRATPQAITSLTMFGAEQNFDVGTTFSLYGIKAWADETTPKATGGYVYSDSTYYYHAFPFSGTFTPNQSLTCDYLVIAGGAGGSYDAGGGGGAGGLRSTVGTTGGGGSLESALSLTAQAYTVTVGAGGAGALTGSRRGANGSDSTLSTVTSTGGGGGGNIHSGGTTGSSGGSGGGGGITGGSGGARTVGQGYAGGGGSSNTYGGGGGGGAGAAGTAGSSTTGGGAGGNGVQITALAYATATGVDGGYYAGGGGGGSNVNPPAPGGLGGGGQGGTPGGANIKSGIVNTGSGGGGCGGGDSTGFGNGGSGLVIVRYAK
jgi:hypothetical protein